jgi:hypothetical protein
MIIALRVGFMRPIGLWQQIATLSSPPNHILEDNLESLSLSERQELVAAYRDLLPLMAITHVEEALRTRTPFPDLALPVSNPAVVDALAVLAKVAASDSTGEQALWDALVAYHRQVVRDRALQDCYDERARELAIRS